MWNEKNNTQTIYIGSLRRRKKCRTVLAGDFQLYKKNAFCLTEGVFLQHLAIKWSPDGG